MPDFLERVECSGCGQEWHTMDCGGCGAEVVRRYVLEPEVPAFDAEAFAAFRADPKRQTMVDRILAVDPVSEKEH